MKKLKQNIFFVLILLVTASITNFSKGQTNSDSSIEFLPGTKIVFADVNEAKKILSAKDEYIKSYTPFDRSIRIKTEEPVSQEEFISFVSKQAMEWTDNERARMENAIKSAAKKLEHLKLKLPPTILMIKTTGAEEGNAGYCRRNAIILPKNMIAPQIMAFQGGFSSQQNNLLEHIFIHELFHTYTIHNPELREKFYEIVGFQKCNPVELPEELKKVEITNPELPKDEYYIELIYKDGTINVMPIITIPNYDYKGRFELSQLLKVQLLAVEKMDDKWQYKRNDTGEPVLFELNDLPNYRRETGDNTSYLIHPEEILAENFVLLVQKSLFVNSKWVIEEMDELFKMERTSQMRENQNLDMGD